MGLFLTLQACESDESILGLEVQPEDQLKPVNTIDTFTIEARNILPSRVRTDETFTYLGQYFTNNSGVSRSSFNVNFQLEAESPAEGGLNYRIDSVVLHLRVQNVVGEYPVSIPINVYQLDQQILRDTGYFSNSRASIDPKPIASTTVSIVDEDQLNDTIQFINGEDTLIQFFQHRIQLDKRIGEQILFGLGTEYRTSEEFRRYFPGVQVGIDSAITGSGDYGIINYNLLTGESGIRLYCTNDNNERLNIFYPVNQNSAYFNQFSHDYSGSLFEQNIADTTDEDENLVIQGMAGGKIEIDIPHLDQIVDLGDIAINKGILRFEVNDDLTSIYGPAPRVFLVATSEDGDELFTFDYIESSERYDGRLDENNGTYEFDVTRQVQSVIEAAESGRDINYPLRLIREVFAVSNSSNIVDETVLKGSDNIVLELHYTNLNE